jgi:muramidase (phage lysozyme)
MNDGKHADTSYHYSDQAFDVPLYPNIQNFGIPDNRKGEEKFSAKVRQLLSDGGFTGAGIGGGGNSSKTQVDPQETVTGKPKSSSGGGGSSKGRWGPILDLIAEGESDTSGGYDAMNPGRNTKAEGKPITQMTMKQVRDMAMSSSQGTGAAGRYQIMPVYNGVNVFKQLVESVGLNYETDLFSPANQDKMGIYRLAVTRGGNDWLSGKMSDEAFGKGISYEWAALKSKSGGAYDGDGKNKSTIGYNRVLKAMGDVKSGKGVSTEDLNVPNMTPGSSGLPQVDTSIPLNSYEFSSIDKKAGTPGSNNQSSGPSTSDLTVPSMTPGSSSLPIVSPKVKPSSRSNIQPPKSRTGSGGIVPLPIPGQKQPTSSSGGNQTDAPMFPSTDQNNPELLVIKSIYNIV